VLAPHAAIVRRNQNRKNNCHKWRWHLELYVKSVWLKGMVWAVLAKSEFAKSEFALVGLSICSCLEIC
jgi:hypothetical protein